MIKGKILVLFFLACCAPLLAAADNAAQTRAKKAAEYRETKESVEQQPAPSPESEDKHADVREERQPPREGNPLENLLEGLLKSGEAR